MKTEELAELLTSAQENREVDLTPLSTSDLSALMIACTYDGTIGTAVLGEKIKDHMKELLTTDEYYNWLQYEIYPVKIDNLYGI